ncbi:MAG: hypothetical protein AMXMBFR84_32470 [Candidatus Hydrogenedentota bacterium]
MKTATHIRTLTRTRPASAALQPVWELIYVGQAMLGLVQSWVTILLQLKGL